MGFFFKICRFSRFVKTSETTTPLGPSSFRTIFYNMCSTRLFRTWLEKWPPSFRVIRIVPAHANCYQCSPCGDNKQRSVMGFFGGGRGGGHQNALLWPFGDLVRQKKDRVENTEIDGNLIAVQSVRNNVENISAISRLICTTIAYEPNRVRFDETVWYDGKKFFFRAV